ncbi:MAG TPA: polysaccharide pyruvyl transferase family protein [Candidatus Limnocylindrales bacterium]|nr:polysaccharide pyruvyl transferase family protein [Candidatus Limnocylindrales bacterium]
MELIASLGRAIDRALDPLVPRGSRCALLDFPAYANVGDSAIWLGERAYLRRRGARIVYTCQHSTYSARRLARSLGDGIILLQGGGNLGDLWLQHQRLREQVIADFPRARIIQLPQSIHFRDPANLARVRALFEPHPRLTVLVRDHPSLVLARDGLRTHAELCPAMTCALGPLAPPRPPVRDIVWLARTDVEGRGMPEPSLTRSEERIDWITERRTLLQRLSQARAKRIGRHPRLLGGTGRIGVGLYDAEARQRLERGRALLARGRVLVTDRLHGHILALLAGQPHVISDTTTGKIGDFFATWTKESPLTTWAEAPAEALERARALVRSSAHAAG